MSDLARTILALAARYADDPGAARDPGRSFDELGLDSLALVALVTDVEAALDVRFPAEMMDAATFANPESVARAIRTLRSGGVS